LITARIKIACINIINQKIKRLNARIVKRVVINQKIVSKIRKH
tara:strand:- start:420 stop:548 length:129 start_codon:yes stop_codon:yes gene_type:complete